MTTKLIVTYKAALFLIHGNRARRLDRGTNIVQQGLDALHDAGFLPLGRSFAFRNRIVVRRLARLLCDHEAVGGEDSIVMVGGQVIDAPAVSVGMRGIGWSRNGMIAYGGIARHDQSTVLQRGQSRRVVRQIGDGRVVGNDGHVMLVGVGVTYGGEAGGLRGGQVGGALAEMGVAVDGAQRCEVTALALV